MHLFSFTTDETVVLFHSLGEFGGVDLLSGRILPHFYDYGTLPFYLNDIWITVGRAYHLVGPIVTGGTISTQGFAQAYLAARLLTVVMGVGTVWAVYALGKRLWSAPIGLLAAAILAVTPLHVQHSHFATVDVGATLWQMLSLLWAARVWDAPPATNANTPESKSWSRNVLLSALLAGVFAGLTAATKYSGVLVLLAVPVAAWSLHRRSSNFKLAFGAVCLAGVGAALAFVIACPGSLLETNLFLAGIQYESDHVMHHGEIYFQQTGPGWIYIVTRNLDAGMGLPLLVTSLAAIIYALVRRNRSDALLAAFALPYYILTGAAQSRYARYEVPFLPILAIWTARFLVDWLTAAWGPKRMVGYVGYAMAAIVLGFTIVDSWVLISPMARVDNREAAAAWLNKNAPPPTQIGFGGFPWFWTPPVNRYFAWPGPSGWIEQSPPSEVARYCYNPLEGLDPSYLLASNTPVVVLSEYEYYDALRLKLPNALRYVDDLREKYNPPIVFSDPHPIGGIGFMDGLPVQDLPTDMLYPRPTILIFTRR
jgi:4-amino-4-deoxy-L-arabinose transferase-like glycosyltransferase